MKKSNKSNYNTAQDINTIEACMEGWGEGTIEAVIRECKKKHCSFLEFLLNFLHSYVDDEFFDYLAELCEKYNIAMYSEEELDELDEFEAIF